MPQLHRPNTNATVAIPNAASIQDEREKTNVTLRYFLLRFISDSYYRHNLCVKGFGILDESIYDSRWKKLQENFLLREVVVRGLVHNWKKIPKNSSSGTPLFGGLNPPIFSFLKISGKPSEIDDYK